MKLGSEEIFYINTFASVSGVSARDVIVQGNNITFVVRKEDIGKAIGKGACNVKTLRSKINKNVEILEFHEKLEDFVKKALYNFVVKGVEVKEKDGKKIAFVSLEAGEKRKLFTNMGRFKRIKEIAKRDYELDDLHLK